jgi:hypothetical protein
MGVESFVIFFVFSCLTPEGSLWMITIPLFVRIIAGQLENHSVLCDFYASCNEESSPRI